MRRALCGLYVHRNDQPHLYNIQYTYVKRFFFSANLLYDMLTAVDSVLWIRISPIRG